MLRASDYLIPVSGVLRFVLTRVAICTSQLISAPAEHSPCTRRVAKALHDAHRRAHGLVWHSRQCELADLPAAQAVVVFGDRIPAKRGAWRRHPGGLLPLDHGAGRLTVDAIATRLGVTIVPAG